jgi:hypothetical protein
MMSKAWKWMGLGLLLLGLAGGAALLRGVNEPEPAPAPVGPPRWFKGNLHTHTLWSDGDDFPEMVAGWYREHGYNFLALSDHNIILKGTKWMKYSEIKKRGSVDAFIAYQRKYGKAVETRGNMAAGTLEVRLKGLEEFRGAYEKPGEFLMIPAEELSDGFGKLPIHIGAVNVAERVEPQGGTSVSDVIRSNFLAIEAQAQRLHRPILVHINHPNFGWGINAQDLASVVEDRFFEVFNGHPGVRQLGDEKHMPIEHMWDVANTIRMTQLGAPPLYGLANDDTHNYHIVGMSRACPGRGWTMVRATSLTPDALIAAMKAGDFYASSGVTLRDVRYYPSTKRLEIEIEPNGDEQFETRFIGTTRDFADARTLDAGIEEKVTPLNSAKVGRVLASVKGLSAGYTLKGNELYVRALILSDHGVDRPVYKGQVKEAWAQPVGWE